MTSWVINPLTIEIHDEFLSKIEVCMNKKILLLSAVLAISPLTLLKEAKAKSFNIPSVTPTEKPGNGSGGDTPPWMDDGGDEPNPVPTTTPGTGSGNGGDLPPWLDDDGNGNGNGNGTGSGNENGDLPPWLDPDDGNGNGNGNGTGTGGGSTNNQNLQDLKTTIALTREMIALGEDYYKLLEKNQPQSKVEYEPISVLPREAVNPEDGFYELENWARPASKRFSLKLSKNGKSSWGKKEAADVVFNVTYSYGGSFNGKGKYLTGVEIVPEEIEVAAGHSLDVGFKLTSIQNYGSKEDPVASATIEVHYKLTSRTKIQEGIKIFYVTGAGEFGRVQDEDISPL